MSDSPSEKKRPGRKRQYESKGYQDGAPRLATRVDPEVLDWVQSRPEGVRPYLERLAKLDKLKQAQRVQVPAEFIGFPKAEPTGKGHIDSEKLQEKLGNYVVQIVAACPPAEGCWQYGTGFLVTHNNIGYLATCAHVFLPQNLRFIIAFKEKEILSELDVIAAFGTPVMDLESDLAYLPILRPQLLMESGHMFCPILDEPFKPVFRVATGYPGRMRKNASLERRDGVDLVGQTSFVINLFQDPDLKAEDAREVRRKHPSATIGFAIENLSCIDKLTKQPLAIPETLGGMSGGPIWGVAKDGEIRPVATLTVESVAKNRPTELYGVPIGKLVSLIGCGRDG